MIPVTTNDLLHALQQPFPPTAIYWKPGRVTKDQTRALALAYANLRAYQNRLDEICGLDWSVTYTAWGKQRLICHLTIIIGRRQSWRSCESMTRPESPDHLLDGKKSRASQAALLRLKRNHHCLSACI